MSECGDNRRTPRSISLGKSLHVANSDFGPPSLDELPPDQTYMTKLSA